ncbi:MAG: domain containing protein [Thermoleophilia bacterium]|nr:domain containing protein [Thermoleophilia bacterium]
MLAAGIDGVLVGIPFLLFLGPGEYFRWTEDTSTFFVATKPWEYLEMLAFLVYAAAMQSSAKQATLGMQVLDLRLVRDDDQAPVSFLRAAGRDLLTYLSAFLLCIGYLMIAFTAKRQALHDKLTNTVVVHDA